MQKRTNKKAKQKSFFFKDYTESEIVVGNNGFNYTKVSLNRIAFLFFVFLSLTTIFCIKIIYLSLFTERNFFSENDNQNFSLERGDIVDRNGIILARNIDIYSAGVRPKIVNDKKKLLLNLKIIFPELDASIIREKLTNNKFFYI